MKHKNLCLLTIILILSACKQDTDIQSILGKLEAPDAGHVFVHTSFTIQNELKNYQQLIENPDVSNDLKEKLRKLRFRTLTMDSLMNSGGEYMMLQAKPPRPCPSDTSSCLYLSEYYSTYAPIPGNPLKIFINDTEVGMEDIAYDELTHIQTMRVPGKLVYNEGDRIRLEMHVQYQDSANNDLSTNVEREFYGTR